jgi:hypothetical protein
MPSLWLVPYDNFTTISCPCPQLPYTSHPAPDFMSACTLAAMLLATSHVDSGPRNPGGPSQAERKESPRHQSNTTPKPIRRCSQQALNGFVVIDDHITINLLLTSHPHEPLENTLLCSITSDYRTFSLACAQNKGQESAVLVSETRPAPIVLLCIVIFRQRLES